MHVSAISPAIALSDPYMTAITVDIIVEIIPIDIDTLPPYHMQENISRPIVSVPNKNSVPGAFV